MDNFLTPNKIQRLIRLAEDKSFNTSRRQPEIDERNMVRTQFTNKSTPGNESSAGIIDLDNVVAFGESGAGSLSLDRHNHFNPGEITGRSTGTDDINSSSPSTMSSAIDANKNLQKQVLASFTNDMERQTEQVMDIMRNSIASNYTFNSRPNLTEDEVSLVMREAPLPVVGGIIQNIPDSSMNSSSVSQYFMRRCQDFRKILTNVDSPDKYMQPSITEVSSINEYVTPQKNLKNSDFDQTLDCVPVRQPRSTSYTENPPPKMSLEHFKKPNDVPGTNKKPNTAPGFSESLVSKNNQKIFDGDVSSTVVSTDEFLSRMQQSYVVPSEFSESVDSLSLSRIADYLGKQSQINLSDMLKLTEDIKKLKKQPLTEVNINKHGNRKFNQDTYLRDSRKTDAVSSSSSINTAIPIDKLKLNQENIRDVPKISISPASLTKDDLNNFECGSTHTNPRTINSKSPSNKSQSTLSTVHENYTSFRSGNSPSKSSPGMSNSSRNVSAKVEYKELDKSVDWREVMQQKQLQQQRFAQDQWAEIGTTPVDGYVGARNEVTITITTLTDSWITGKITFDTMSKYENNLSIEMPRLPLLLSPRKSEHLTLFITSNIEIDTTLVFKVTLNDASIDAELHQSGTLDVKIKLPTLQAMSSEGLNKLSFPPVREKTSVTKSLVLINECKIDLQLDLTILQGENYFSIKSIKEIKNSEINKVLLERQGSDDDLGKGKSKLMNKQLCRVTAGNAVRVAVTYNAPKLSAAQMTDYIVTFQGSLNVSLISGNVLIKKIDLIGTVGIVNLAFKTSSKTLRISRDVSTLEVSNNGSIAGNWVVKLESLTSDELPFTVTPNSFELRPGGEKALSLSYTGPSGISSEAILIFEEVSTGSVTTIDIIGCIDRPKSFPIKTNHSNMSWVREGRKELSLKNTTDKKIQIKCLIVGEGFNIDLPGVDSRGTYCLTCGPCECRPLAVMFSPSDCTPRTATLYLVMDKDSEFSRKINLFGAGAGYLGGAVRWAGLATYGDTALLRAHAVAPVLLPLANKARVDAFVAASVHFNLQYRFAKAESHLLGSRRIVRGRGSHTLTLRVNWARVQRLAHAPHAPTALASVNVLSGAEITRRRILRILRDKNTGELDLSLLPPHLTVLADTYEGEDPNVDCLLEGFNETKDSLNELISGLQELTAQIDLPPDFNDDNTIIISDETVLDHHTLCD